MVNLAGGASGGLRAAFTSSSKRHLRACSERRKGKAIGVHDILEERPPDPFELISDDDQKKILNEHANRLRDWFNDKNNVLCITGAGLSTESGIPDYRGHAGSYHKGHKPMIHDQFVKFESQRKRYWGRSLIGWKAFSNAKPNCGHHALAALERANKIGVDFVDKFDYYSKDNEDKFTSSSGFQKMSIITQNVDRLHSRAGIQHITELHGRTDTLRCMNCGSYRSRYDFHDELERINRDWVDGVLGSMQEEEERGDGNNNKLRPDGDAYISKGNYNDLVIPSCEECGDAGFMKPDVVFFGDNVPCHRVERCRGAVESSDGLLVVGSSLAVHSAFRFVRLAHESNIPIAIVNVGKTRLEIEAERRKMGNNNKDIVTKIEAPAGPLLSLLAAKLTDGTQ